MFIRCTYRGRIAIVLSAIAMVLLAVQPVAAVMIDASGGTSFNPNILGQCPTTGCGDDAAWALNVSYNSSVRGVAGGLDADTYNWQDLSGANVGGTCNGQDWTTLNFLRGARDHSAAPLFTANIRGIGTGMWNTFAYTDTSASTLATVASQWVRYTNYILQNYRQGDTLSASDAAILSKVSWGTNDANLLARGEAVTPKVAYWEVGNEPEKPRPPRAIYYYIAPADYVSRYKTISAAMVGQDATIKVGPCCSGANAQLAAVLADPAAQVNFVSYHPYGAARPLVNDCGLRGIKAQQTSYYQAEVKRANDCWTAHKYAAYSLGVESLRGRVGGVAVGDGQLHGAGPRRGGNRVYFRTVGAGGG